MHEPVAPLIGGRRHQRFNLNVYDSVFLPDIAHHRFEMFGRLNIGTVALTNLQVPYQLLPGDQYAVIQNWYARVSYVDDLVLGVGSEDNQRRSDARAEWVESTTVTLVLGSMPVHQLPLSDLLRRREGYRDALLEHQPSIEDLAKRSFELGSALLYDGTGILPLKWERLTDRERAATIAEVRFLRSQLCCPVLAVVPERQHVSVILETDMRLLGRVIEAGPRDALRFWVHLEGIACLDLESAFS